MKNLSILFKISGDLIYNKDILNELQESAKKYSNTGLIYGFGTILSKRLKDKGIPFYYTDGIRKTTADGLAIALETSNEIKSFLESKLRGINLISPITIKDGEIINTNADELVLKNAEFYDSVIIYTLKGRDKNKFKKLNKVEIREISNEKKNNCKI